MKDNQPEISVIISTYNAVEWLRKVLWGYQCQSFQNFELVIADDGSKEETKNLIELFSQTVPFQVRHVWHPDRGFQKSEILNKAIIASRAEYIVMSDGDCIPRADFLQVHYNQREKGRFLSGGYFKLPMGISQKISREDIETQDCFSLSWLRKNGLQKSFKNNKITAQGFTQKILNFLTPTKPTWNGHNASGWKKDLLSVNGFDQRMQYGGQDRELGERLVNLGIKGKQIRYSAVVLHLDHPRGYATPESWKKNHAIRKNTRSQKIIRTEFGIDTL